MTSDIRRFGTTAAGQTVEAITLRAGELTARVLTFGATLQDLRLAGTPGRWCWARTCSRLTNSACIGAARWSGRWQTGCGGRR
ncbi:hypothetical protein [Rhodobacter capsulatus]|uniref:hypothetical protein n=1 Tax=Rhodobacter capsulatus TaxID=1061 RepID=UPI004028837F